MGQSQQLVGLVDAELVAASLSRSWLLPTLVMPGRTGPVEVRDLMVQDIEVTHRWNEECWWEGRN
jgi:hypothetical protein